MNRTKISSLSFLVIIQLLCACEKSATPIQPTDECVAIEKITSTDSSFYIYYSGHEENGYATAIKLNKDWRASVSTSIFNNRYNFLFLTFLSKDEPNWKTEAMEFNFSHLNTGCYTIINANINDTTAMVESNYLALDYDVIEDAYVVLEEEANNYIEIDTLDLNSKRVSGKFMVSFKRDGTRTGKKYNPEYLRFFNGEFHCNINW